MKLHHTPVLLTVLMLPTAVMADGFSMGVRSWLSEGQTEWSHCAGVRCGGPVYEISVDGSPIVFSLGDPTSRLNYSGMSAATTEIFAERTLDQQWRINATLGVGSGNSGTFRDQDWIYLPAARQNLEFSDTESQVRDTRLSYYTLDMGKTYTWPQVTMTPFLGYVHYNESASAYGLRCLPTDLDFGCQSLSNSLKVIHNDITWTGLRLGSEWAWPVGNQGHIVLNTAYVLNAKGNNDDSHLLRTSPSDLGNAPNIHANGTGDGWMVDVSAHYSVGNTWRLHAGYRWWTFEANTGEVQFGSDPRNTYPTRSLFSRRSGLLLGARYAFE